MEEQENRNEPFSLEDILKEFHAEPEPGQEEPPQEDVLIWDGTAPAAPRKEPAVQDTVRLDEITRAVNRQCTQETVTFTPVEEQEDEPLPPPQEEKAEPYSEDWEPEYEQPIGEYVPQEPIVFRPKSRLQELKRKLVAGPEKRYYDLTELGLGRLQAAILACFLVAAGSAAVTVMYTMGTIGPDRIKLVIFLQFLSLLLSALFGSYQLIEGAADLFKGRFSLNSLLLFNLLACVADGVLCLWAQRVPCCAAFSLNMTMSLWSAYQKRNTEMGQMDTMRKAIRLDSVVCSPDLYEGRPGFLRAQGQVEDFMDTYNAPSGAEKVMSVYALAALAVSLAIGIAAGVLYDLSMGVQAFAVALLVAVPASSHIALSRPMALLERRLHKEGTVLCGWQGVKGLCVNGVFPVGDEDLFPSGTAKLNGLKFYGKRSPDDTVAYAAALVNAGGGGLAPLFTQLLDSRSGCHYEAEGFRFYEGGIGAEVNGEAVLAGSQSFLQDMGVEMPNGTRVNQAVYVAIDGQLCGVFALSYAKSKSAAAGLTTLCAYRGLNPVLAARNFMLAEDFIRSKFGVNTHRIAFPDGKTRAELSRKEPEEGAAALALTTREGLSGMAYAVTGARALRSASVAGVAVHMAGGILGLCMILVLGILGAEHLLTPGNVLLYELIWMLPGLLITEWTRSV